MSDLFDFWGQNETNGGIIFYLHIFIWFFIYFGVGYVDILWGKIIGNSYL